jgi:hypothetical protein
MYCNFGTKKIGIPEERKTFLLFKNNYIKGNNFFKCMEKQKKTISCFFVILCVVFCSLSVIMVECLFGFYDAMRPRILPATVLCLMPKHVRTLKYKFNC